MKDQPLFTLTGNDHPDTSHEAAQKVARSASTQRARIVELFHNSEHPDLRFHRGNWTDAEIGFALEMEMNSVRPRRVGLVRDGVLELDVKRLCCVTGNKSQAWKLTTKEE